MGNTRHGRAGTTRRVAGSVAVLGVAAAVAGLGTYSSFTDSTSPVQTGADSGVLSLALQADGAAATQPFEGRSLLAGDSVQQVLDLVNDGTTAFGSITMAMSATASSILDTDTVHGLQLTVESCSEPWGGSATARSCAGTRTPVYAGPMVVSRALSDAASLEPGGVDHLLLTASLPTTASGTAYQGRSSTLSLVFEGVQRAGAER